MWSTLRGCSLVMLVVGLLGTASAEDAYYYLPLTSLAITQGELPNSTTVAPPINWRQVRGLSDFRYPYAAGSNGEEIYVAWTNAERGFFDQPQGNLINAMFIAMRASEGTSPSGSLFLPKPDWSGMSRVAFRIAAPAADQLLAKEQFLKAKEQHYQRLLASGIPGAAWFRHQMRDARSARDNSPPANADRESPASVVEQSGLEATYSLFSGGRAVSENLQLDRELRVAVPGDETIPLDSIAGITMTEIDWAPIVQDLQPEKDVLAAFVPADQHVIFFPSFQAMLTLMDESAAQGAPVLRLLESRAEDADSAERYQRQLCLPTTILSRLFGPRLVKSVALTGSDPYLRTGADVAVLFEAVDVNALHTVIALRQAEAAGSAADAKRVNGAVQDVAYQGIASPDRSICSYLAVIENVVVVANSLTQLAQLVKASRAQIPSMATLAEYTFFRDRYPLGAPDETALLIVSDAAIRRWCSPRWRIAASRRTRAAAALAELQAEYLDQLYHGQMTPELLAQAAPIPGLGDVQFASGKIASSLYGTLEFLTPISELPIENVTLAEQNAYIRFLQNYQRRWSWYFDPIALRFTVQPDRIATDLTIRPLIAASEYRDFVALTGNAAITSASGDPHPQAILHGVLSLNVNSSLVRQIEYFAAAIAAQALNWLGNWIAIYVDDDPFWQELEAVIHDGGVAAAETFMQTHVARWPAAIAVDVANVFKLTVFLASARAFIEQSAPGLYLWETRTHNEQGYVRIAPSEAARADLNDAAWRDVALYYAATPRMLVFALHEDLLKRALDRIAARRHAPADGQEVVSSGSWLGKNLSLQANRKALDLLQFLTQDDVRITMARRVWGNLAILNEWRRRYGAIDLAEFHRTFWQTNLVSPGGGAYVWNREFQTMESTVFGHPGQPKTPFDVPHPLTGLTSANMGVTFEADGLRARVELRRSAE